MASLVSSFQHSCDAPRDPTHIQDQHDAEQSDAKGTVPRRAKVSNGGWDGDLEIRQGGYRLAFFSSTFSSSTVLLRSRFTNSWYEPVRMILSNWLR